MKTRLLITFCLTIVSVRAEDITLRDGTILKHAKVTETTPAYISVTHDTGVAHIMLQDLPVDLQKKYGYDPAKASSYAAADAATQQQIAKDIAQREAAARAAQQKMYQSTPPLDPAAEPKVQLQQVQTRRRELETELSEIHQAQKEAGPLNKVTHTKGHTAWGHIKSIYTSANAGELAARERDVRQQIEDLKRKEQWLREKSK